MKNIDFQNLSFISNFKLTNKNKINSSLNNISKQLNNISLNDVNILNLKYGKKKMNSTNRINKAHSRIYSSKSYKGKTSIYKFRPFNINESFNSDNNLIIDNADSFSIINNIDGTKVNLRKKNLILKENLKLLLNEVKKYKKHEKDNTKMKEYEEQIEYYINELEKYHKEIILLKEKYIAVIKENEELKKYINFEMNKLNNSQLLNSICKTDENKPPYEKLNKIKNLNSFRYLNLNLKNYMDKFRKNNTCTYQISAKTSRNIKKNKNDNYLLIEDNNEEKNIEKNNNNNNKSEIFQRNALKKINNNLKTNNQNILQKLKKNYNKNINQIIFKKNENKNKIHNNINKTLSKNRINQNSLKDNSFEINKSINLSQSFRYYNDKNNNKKLEKKNFFLNKYNNYIYFNNQTFNDS